MRLAMLLFCACFVVLQQARASDPADESAAGVFKRWQDSIVQVRILDNGAGTKTAIGSGFFASASGHVVTNYHVIAQLVRYPGQFRGEVVYADQTTGPLELVTFDIVHDLAVVRVKRAPEHFFVPIERPVPKGERVFALGNPHDLGLTIVEGTYNGFVADTLYEKIHFTGSLNPGMSGGPAVAGDGSLVGVNVSTAGNQLSFLVPSKFVGSLLREAEAVGAVLPHDLMSIAAAQLLVNQGEYVAQTLASEPKRIELGRYSVPGQLSRAFHCWSNIPQKEDLLYAVNTQLCSTEDKIFIAEGISAGSISFAHTYLSTTKLNAFQFAGVVETAFHHVYHADGEEEDFTSFECTQGYFATGGIRFKGALCLRAYRKLRGLYDVVLRAASYGESQSAVITTLNLSGVSYDNAQRFVQAYLKEFQWNRP